MCQKPDMSSSSVPKNSIVFQKLLMSGTVALGSMFLHYHEHTDTVDLSQSHIHRPAASNTHRSTKCELIHGWKYSEANVLFSPVWVTFAKNYSSQLFLQSSKMQKNIGCIYIFVDHSRSRGTNELGTCATDGAETLLHIERLTNTWFKCFHGICWQ